MQLEDFTNEFEHLVPGLKTTYKNYVITTETNLLEQTDWMYVRKKERNIDVPLDAISNRATITAEADRLRNAIDAATTEEEVLSAFRSASWPEDN